jgi:hypothetical protein
MCKNGSVFCFCFEYGNFKFEVHNESFSLLLFFFLLNGTQPVFFIKVSSDFKLMFIQIVTNGVLKLAASAIAAKEIILGF